jgi:hypothetical protein
LNENTFWNDTVNIYIIFFDIKRHKILFFNMILSKKEIYYSIIQLNENTFCFDTSLIYVILFNIKRVKILFINIISWKKEIKYLIFFLIGVKLYNYILSKTLLRNWTSSGLKKYLYQEYIFNSIINS